MTRQKTSHVTLSTTFITGLRLAWLVLFFTLAAVFILGIPFRYNELAEVCRVEPCILTLRLPEADLLAEMGLSMQIFAAYHIGVEVVTGATIAAMAVVFFWRRFDEPMGILLAFMLALFGLNFMVESDTAFINYFPQFYRFHSFISSLAMIPFILFLFIFPDGRFVPRWAWVVLPAITILAVIDPFILRDAFAIPSGQFSILFVFAFIIFVLLGVGVQIYRYLSTSTPAQRQQTKWVILGFMALLVPLMGWTLFIELFPPPPGMPRLLFFTFGYGIMASFLMFFPISFVIAITRYRLWDIDLLIRRTLVYSVLTGTLIFVYFGSVVMAQTAVNSITGREQSSQLVIALSTLLIAALFNPLRRRIQAFIDRRFYRRKYDAECILARFAETARDETNIERLSAELVQVTREAIQPEQISLWLKSEQ